jgi:thymidylate synthase (FAD)
MSVELVHSLAHDQLVANSARVIGEKSKPINAPGVPLDNDDVRLINYMMANRHGTPFEHNYFQFRVRVPIFAQRDWMRHRVGHSFNEISTRWQDMSETGIYEPEAMRTQVGKAHEYLYEDFDALHASVDEKIGHWCRRKWLVLTQRRAIRTYKRMIKRGYAREQAMAVLPMGTYTEFIWSCNARSLMHFLGLRNKPNARREIQEVCAALEEHFSARMPVTYNAWVKNGRVAP